MHREHAPLRASVALRSRGERSRLNALVVLAAFGMLAQASAQTIDLSAQGNCDLAGDHSVSVGLPTGIYTMLPVHGQYQAWFRWPGGTIGCDASGGNCENGWTTFWDVRRADGTIEHYPSASVPVSDRWATPELALAHAHAATLVTHHYEFVNFFIYDAPCSDNAGGVSLDLSPCLAIDIGPIDEAACGSSAVFYFVGVVGVAPFSYAWQIETSPAVWTDLHEGVNVGADSATFEALHTDTRVLQFRSLSGHDARVRCVITNTCGSVTTNVVPFHTYALNDPVCPSCYPDVNQDGVNDQGDVDYLINVIAGGENPTGVDPDFNLDGVADQGDIDAVVNVIAGGPCP